MSNKMLPKQTSFEDRLPTTTHVDGFNLKPTLGPADLPAVQSDIAAITAGTTINPSTGTISLWKNAENPTFTAANAITIDQGSEVNPLAAPGSPVRFSDDGATWKYGIITGVVTQASTLDLTIKGVAMTLANTAFFEVGSPGLVVTRQIIIPGDLTVDNDQVNTVLKSKILWTLPGAFLVYAGAFVNTAASGADVLAAVARGAVGNEIASSTLNLGQATALVDSGTTIDDSNYEISFLEELFVKVTQIGSTTPGSDLTVLVMAILNEYQFVEFIPQAAPVPDFAFQFTGGTGSPSWSNSSTDSIDFFSMLVSVGSGADRGDDTISRTRSGCCFDATRSFNMGGQNPTIRDEITFIDTPSITGNGVDRGDLFNPLVTPVGVSGSTHGFTLGGRLASGFRTSDIYTLLLGAATGDALNRGDLPAAHEAGSGGYDNDTGIHSGGIGPASFFVDDIFGLNIATTIGGALNRGDLIAANGAHAALSDIDNNTVFTCGGTTNNTSLSSGQVDSIQSTDLTLATNNATDRDDLARVTGYASANSGDTIGYISGGGTNPAAVIGAIDKFTYGTGTLVVSNRGTMLVPKHGAGGDM